MTEAENRLSPRTFRELVERYQRGERDFVGSDLDGDSENDLRGLCLEGIDLSRSFLVADLRGASLRRARFIGANIKTCDFRDADLRDADFTGAAICATQFAGANVEGATFAGARFHSFVLDGDTKPDW
jgi:uncharacterized protein YjbI with pentapeptide repeats